MEHKIEVHWEITNDCNLRCRHCIVSAGDFKKDDVGTPEILKFIDKLKGQQEVQLSFTGGEPFKRKDFIEIVKYSLKNKMQVQIITNGLIFTDESLQLIKNNGIQLGISIESFNKKNYEAIRGANTFNKLMKNIEKLRLLNIPFDVYTTINSYNINEIPEILAKVKEYGCEVHFNELTIDGRAKDNDDIITDNTETLNKIINASKMVFGIDNLESNDKCWGTNDILFIASNGDIYLCTEQNRCNKRTKLGNIKSFPIDEYYKNCPSLDYYDIIPHCPYKVYYNDYITYVSNVNVKCSLLSSGKTIDSLEELYAEFDSLFDNMLPACKKCTFKDCMGFIWLLNQEKEKCDINNITTININEEIDFLNFAKGVDLETVNFEELKYPECEHRCSKSGKCLIHNLRPLVCHMYPIGIETSEDGTDIWVLHDECLFVQNLINDGNLSEFVKKANSIINRINARLYKEIVLKYRQVDKISLFLNGINSYIILKEVDWDVKM